MEFELTEHALDMLTERKISRDWVKSTIEHPDSKETDEDGTIHYIKSIEEHGGRFLRIVANPKFKPLRIVTLFFDRRLRRLK